jgi:hypothetical protein
MPPPRLLDDDDDDDDDDDSSSPLSKKRKKAGGAGAAKACDLDGGVPEVTLAVAMLDGTKFSVTVPGRGCVREVKREIAKVQKGSAVLPAAAFAAGPQPQCVVTLTCDVCHCVCRRMASPLG